MPSQVDRLLEEIRKAAKVYDAGAVEELSEELVNSIREDIAANPKGFVQELEQAVREFDRKRVGELCELLVRHVRRRAKPYPLQPAKEVLAKLRRKRYFDLVTTVADALIQTGQDGLNIRRQYAQGLLDQGYLTAAHDVLQLLEADAAAAKDDKELAETRGLMGRAKKQMYMDAAAEKRPGAVLRESLSSAISSYAGEFKRKKGLIWHGINTVALLERARRDGVKVDKLLPDVGASAQEILKQIAAKKQANLWDLATAGEACLALQDYSQALDWIVKYTEEESADAFDYASTLRQFEEVWKLDGSKQNQAKILSLLRSALLRQEGGRVEIKDPKKDLAAARELETDKQFEQVLGTERYKTFRWYNKGLRRAEAVAKIVDRNGNGHGTGFLLRGSDVHESLGERWVLVTNAHVISEDLEEQAGSPGSLSPDDVLVRFEASESEEELEVDEILFTSRRNELDCTIVTLQSEVTLENPIRVAKRLPRVDSKTRVYVIGHPRGGGLSFSLDDNLLLDHQKPKVHYRAPTEGGSSGSPVFNENWDLIALHHAGGMEMTKLNGKPGTYPANEGLAFKSILGAVKEQLG